MGARKGWDFYYASHNMTVVKIKRKTCVWDQQHFSKQQEYDSMPKLFRLLLTVGKITRPAERMSYHKYS